MFKRLFRRAIPTLASVDAYAKWAATYPPSAHNALMRAEEAAMRELMPDLRGKVVLDLACGTGRYGLMAQNAGASSVIALDNSPDMLKANPLRWRALATTEAIPLASASVDVLLCGLALGHLPHLEPTMNEIGRVLASNGIALISDVHPSLFANGAKAQRTFTASDGTVYAVEHYPHRIERYTDAGRAAGLDLDVVREPHSPEAPSPVAVAIVYRFIKRSFADG